MPKSSGPRFCVGDTSNGGHIRDIHCGPMNASGLQTELLKWKMLPARLTPEKVAEILGFSPHEISVLMGVGLLKPLGKPAPNAHKYFCASEILELSYNREWLDKATRVISKHWQDKNRREKEHKLAASSI